MVLLNNDRCLQVDLNFVHKKIDEKTILLFNFNISYVIITLKRNVLLVYLNIVNTLSLKFNYVNII